LQKFQNEAQSQTPQGHQESMTTAPESAHRKETQQRIGNHMPEAIIAWHRPSIISWHKGATDYGKYDKARHDLGPENPPIG
jgi:hypothetical protein